MLILYYTPSICAAVRNSICNTYFLFSLVEFAHPVWKFDSTFSRKYPSKHKLIDADRIDELNRKLISQTEGRYWNEYMPSTTSHYQLGSYDRFALYCVMRYVSEDDFEKCHEKFKVPGGQLNNYNKICYEVFNITSYPGEYE